MASSPTSPERRRATEEAGAASGWWRSARSEQPTTALHQWLNFLVVSGILGLNVLQRMGTTTFDTKLDLTQDPVNFMQRALSVWTPGIDMGSLQNQAYGYLFPIGPFFALGHAIGAPMWLWQRLWSALLMLVAYWGMKQVARELGTVGSGAAVLAGLSYAMAPRMLMTIGVLTGESIPAVVLPWTLVPLLRASRGRTTWARAVVLSAATVPFMSGVNASEVICALLLPFLIIVCSPLPGVRRLRLTLGWGSLIGVVCAWWIGPLLILGRYAPPFLNYIESAAVTTAPMTWTTVLRGDTDWLAFLPVSVSHWQTGHTLTYSALLALSTALVGVLGLAGLCLIRFPHRRAFLIAAVVALTIMALGHGGLGGSPLSGPFRSFLDGPGAPFRNIHKLDPVVRVGVSIGLAMLVTRLRPIATAVAMGRRLPSAIARRAPMAVLTALVLLLGLPAYQGGLRDASGWQQIPQPWQEMQQQLEALPASSRVLILPGASSADQTWGRTVDELPQTMRGVNWAVRGQVPLAGPGGVRLLDSIEQHVGTGEPAPGLAALLADSGFTDVLVRGDLAADPGSGQPSLTRVEATLDSSGGFHAGPSFGSSGTGGPMLQLYSIDGAQVDARARAVQLAEVPTLNGESDQLPSLFAAGVLRANELALTPTSTSTPTGTATTQILTEGPERRERNFGRVDDAVTSVLTPNQPWELKRAAHDYAAVTTRPPATVDYGAIRQVTASSSADSVTQLTPTRADNGPWAAFDGLASTQFVSQTFTKPRGQWVQADLARRQAVGRITITTGTPSGAVTAVRVTTDQGSQVLRMPASGKVATVDLGGRTSFVRVTIEAVRDAFVSQVSIAGIDLQDVHPQRTEDVSGTADADTTMAFRTWSGRSECVRAKGRVTCDALSAVGAEEAAGMARRVQVSERGRWDVRGTARITSGQLANSLLRPPGRGVSVQASSTYDDQPLEAPMRAMDGNPTTGWTSNNGDTTPWLDLSWGRPRKVTDFTVAGVRGTGPGLDPRVSSVMVDGKSVRFRQKGDQFKLQTPVTGRSIRIGLSSPLGLPMGVSEISVPALSDLVYTPKPSYRTSLPCGFAPTITVDGRSIRTRLEGTIGDVTSGAPMKVVPCQGAVTLTPGKQRLAMNAAPGMVPATLTFTPAGERRVAQHGLPVQTVTWKDEQRTVRIGGHAEALLSVPENINAGWTATMNGQTLRPVTVNAWGQGFVVPAGSDRTVHLSYRPAGAFRAALFGGAIGVIAVWLLGAALLLCARDSADRPMPPGLRRIGHRLGAVRPRFRRFGGVHRERGRFTRAAALSAAYLPGTARTRVSTPRTGVWWGALLVLAMLLFGGLGPAVGALLGLLAGRWRNAVVAATIVVVALSALFWALQPLSSTAGAMTDVVSGLGFGALIGLACALQLPNRLGRGKTNA